MPKKKQSFQTQRQHVKRLETLIDASKVLNTTLDLEKLLGLILGLAMKNLKAARGTIYLIDWEKQELWSKVLKGKDLVEIRLPIGTGIAGHVAKTGKTVNLKDAWKDKRFFSGFDLRTGFQTKTMLCMPMRDRNKKVIGVFQILNKRQGTFDKDDEQFLEAFSLHAALAIETARLHQAIVEKEKMEKEIEIAANIQRRLLPKEIPFLPGYEIDAVARPSKHVGGDYFDIIPLAESKFALVVADVSGKGVPAALLVSTLQASLHAYIEGNAKLPDLVKKLNGVVYRNTEPDRYITFFIGVLDLAKGLFTYVNAGHNFPYVFNPTKNSIDPLKAGGLPLGMFDFAEFQEDTVNLSLSEGMVLYTDGVTEAMDRSFTEYGEERFQRSIKESGSGSVNALKDRILLDIEQFVGGEPQSDDLTFMVLKRVG